MRLYCKSQEISVKTIGRPKMIINQYFWPQIFKYLAHETTIPSIYGFFSLRCNSSFKFYETLCKCHLYWVENLDNFQFFCWLKKNHFCLCFLLLLGGVENLLQMAFSIFTTIEFECEGFLQCELNLVLFAIFRLRKK